MYMYGNLCAFFTYVFFYMTKEAAKFLTSMIQIWSAFTKYSTLFFPLKLMVHRQNPLGGRWCHLSCLCVKFHNSSQLLCLEYRSVQHVGKIFAFMQNDWMYQVVTINSSLITGDYGLQEVRAEVCIVQHVL